MRIDVKEELWCSKSSRLKGKRILVLGTGSVALYKTIDLVRDLIRDGGDVEVMLSPDAVKLVTPDTFEWASGNKPITEITGNVEHVLLAGDHSQKVDLVVIAPLTATTLGKIVNGIADTNVSLTAMTAIGSKIPILIVPGMHKPMFDNPFVKENLGKLTSIEGISYIEPRLEEGKAKVAEISTVVNWSIRLLTEAKLDNKTILVTGGPTKEKIDHVRFITNPSSGKMGYALAMEAWYLGAEVVFVVGPNNLSDLSLFRTKYVESAENMAVEVRNIVSNSDIDIGIFSSAVADYTPVSFDDSKITSGKPNLSIQLKPTIKILDMVREIKKEKNIKKLKIIGFKAEFEKTKQQLEVISRKYIEEKGINLMIANLIGTQNSGFAVDDSEVLLIDANNSESFHGTKSSIAQKILLYFLDNQ